MSEVVALLKAAQTAHTRYRAAAGRIDKQGKVSQRPDLRACGTAVKEALIARLEATRLDPLEEDPAWIDDRQVMKGQTSDELIDFYSQYLARAQTVGAVAK